MLDLVVPTIKSSGDSVICLRVLVGAGNRAEALDINWDKSVFGPDSICVAVVDPWELGCGVAIAMETDHDVSGTTDDSTLVRTDCDSRATVVPDTWIWDRGAWMIGVVAADGAVEGAGIVSELLA